MGPQATAPISRRLFLGLSAAGVAGLAGIGRGGRADAREMGAIDAHTHFYDPTRPMGVPWPGKDDRLLYRKVLPAELKALTKKLHIRSTIAVEASPWLEDNQWLLDLARDELFIAGVVGNLDPARDDFAKHFDHFARQPLFRGIRINHAGLERGVEHEAYLANLKRLVDQDRELDVNGGPDMPASVARLHKVLPELRIVINHAANVPIDGKAVPEAWRKGMQAAAAGKQVYCKLSALVEATGKTKGDAPADVELYRPVLDCLWGLFGEDRLIYGSNWPVCERSAPYSRAHEIVRVYFEERGAIAAEKFFLRNAVAAYKPPDRERK
jgi:predicted TIM-barrel fold metal-dependent hydrolase